MYLYRRHQLHLKWLLNTLQFYVSQSFHIFILYHHSDQFISISKIHNEDGFPMTWIDWDMNCQYKEWYLQLQFWFILREWRVRGVGGVGGKGVGGWEGEEREGARSYPTGDDSSPLQLWGIIPVFFRIETPHLWRLHKKQQTTLHSRTRSN